MVEFGKNTEMITDSLVDKIIDFGDKAYLKSQKLSSQIEESGIKEKLYTNTAKIFNKGLELSAEAYIATSDKISEINVIIDGFN